MPNYDPIIQEYFTRKAQVLNLETRLFITVFLLEIVFVLFYFVWQDKVRQRKSFSLIALSVYLILFFEMVAINGKMGLISMYLRQMESYLSSLGHEGLIWESKALDTIIFVPGNAFTLPATLTILVLLAQSFYVFYATLDSLFKSKLKIVLTGIFGTAIIALVVKTITVDFYRQLPEVFR